MQLANLFPLAILKLLLPLEVGECLPLSKWQQEAQVTIPLLKTGDSTKLVSFKNDTMAQPFFKAALSFLTPAVPDS